jgi:hypothetical protein
MNQQEGHLAMPGIFKSHLELKMILSSLVLGGERT